MWSDFRPTLLFLFRFFLTYGLLSAAYGFFIKQYDQAEPQVRDPFTHWVVEQVAQIAKWQGYEVVIEENAHLNYAKTAEEQTFDTLIFNDIRAIAVEEGCNGLSVMILFVSFVLAFGGNFQRLLWFIPAGLLLIHLSNLIRLYLLAILKVDFEGQYFHFFHKYGFTAVIYLSVFLLWYVWVQFLVKPSAHKNANEARA